MAERLRFWHVTDFTPVRNPLQAQSGKRRQKCRQRKSKNDFQSVPGLAIPLTSEKSLPRTVRSWSPMPTFEYVFPAIRGIQAVVLGGSHARGRAQPGSDIDLGLLYSEAAPFLIQNIRELAEAVNDTPRPVVTEFYGWGPWVNGGAWLTVGGQRVDFVYRSLEHLGRVIADAEAGRYELDYAQQPPFRRHKYFSRPRFFNSSTSFLTSLSLARSATRKQSPSCSGWKRKRGIGHSLRGPMRSTYKFPQVAEITPETSRLTAARSTSSAQSYLTAGPETVPVPKENQ